MTRLTSLSQSNPISFSSFSLLSLQSLLSRPTPSLLSASFTLTTLPPSSTLCVSPVSTCICYLVATAHLHSSAPIAGLSSHTAAPRGPLCPLTSLPPLCMVLHASVGSVRLFLHRRAPRTHSPAPAAGPGGPRGGCASLDRCPFVSLHSLLLLSSLRGAPPPHRIIPALPFEPAVRCRCQCRWRCVTQVSAGGRVTHTASRWQPRRRVVSGVLSLCVVCCAVSCCRCVS